MDCIIINADVRTMAGPPRAARASAVAVRGNRISQVGETAAIRALAATSTRVIDARGRLLLPGFNDAHVHFMEGGYSLGNVQLRDAATPEEFVRRIGAHAQKIPGGEWITGGEWDHQTWPGAPMPNRRLIDPVTAANPVFLSRTDGHIALANTLALKMAGVTRQSQDIPGGLIERDAATGEPTGILKDAVMEAVRRIIPKPGYKEQKAAAQRATDCAARLGVTSVQDVLAGDDAAIYKELADRGELKTRVYALYPLARWEELARAADRPQTTAGMVRMGGVKAFADGSLGAGTACFFEPFADDPGNRGLLSDQMYPDGAMLRRVLGADSAGLQVAIHAIGDRANYEILNLLEIVARENGARDRRFRIEHAQHLRPAEVPRFARQQVIASVQPYHAADDGRWCLGRIGPQRVKEAYCFRSLLDSGAALALGTDWTVAPLDPMLTIEAAVTRRTLDGKHSGGWQPEQRISVEEAVRAYTAGSARAEFTESEKGSIVAGRLADLVLLDRNIFEMAPEEIHCARVALTMVDGRVVWEEP
jgi:hypothetical protein